MSDLCQLWLTCADKKEADKIAKALLNKHLIACAKQVPVESAFWWQGKIDNAKEILILMDSRLDLFDNVEAEVAKLHSYDTPNLQAVPVAKINQKAQKWLKAETNG